MRTSQVRFARKVGVITVDEIKNGRQSGMEIVSVGAFARAGGGENDGCAEAYFVRLTGVDASLCSEVEKMDEMLCGRMREGKGMYRRLEGLPRLSSVEDAGFYAECYDKWLENGGEEIQTKNPADAALGKRLGRAVRGTLAQSVRGGRQENSSMQKNFAVKLLYWFDFVTGGEAARWLPAKRPAGWSAKVVAHNIARRQEYLFFYLLTLLGIDVLLLESGVDIAGEEERLGLSRKHVLGEFSACSLPACPSGNGKKAEPRDLQKAQGAGSSPGPSEEMSSDTAAMVRVHLPERRRRPARLARMRPGEDGSAEGLSGTGAGRTESAQAGLSDPDGAQRQSGEQKTAVESAGDPIRIHLPERRKKTSGELSQSGIPGQSGEQKTTVESAGDPIRIHLPERAGKPSGKSSQNRVPESSRSAAGASGVRREKTFEELALLASSVVLIAIHDDRGEVVGTGSGIMVGRDGYLLTNHHVASGGRYYSVRVEEDEKVYRTDEIIKYNSVLDLAVLRIARRLNPIPVYRGAAKPVRGQKVVAIGSPLGLFNSVSDGIISGFRTVDGVDMIQFTAPISHGSSGGAVLNMYGEVIGISTAGMDAGQNLNLAVGYESINLFIKGFV